MGIFELMKKAINAVEKIKNYNVTNQRNFKTSFTKQPTISTLKKHPRYKDKRQDVVYQFDIDKMSFYDCGKCGDSDYADFYFIPAEYHNKVTNECININILLSNVHKEHPTVPRFKYDPSALEFYKRNQFQNNFSWFRHHPITYNGKPNSIPYSISLKFGAKNNSFFDIYYNIHGYPFKARLICWSANTCYEFKARVYNKEFQITSAYKKNGIENKKIFDIDYNLRMIRQREYEWVCKNIPEFAPKSLSAYTRMKNARSQSYQNIEAAALKLGKKLYL